MAEVKLRLNLDAEEVELVVNGQVALTSGKDVFTNWVSAVNEKHKPEVVAVAEPVVAEPVVPAAPVAVPAPVEEVVVPVNETVIEAPSLEAVAPEPLVPAEEV